MDIMTPERAKEIVSAINDRCFYTMGIGTGKLDSLEGVTLGEMLQAKEIVEQGNASASSAGGSYSISLIPDDRLIAAAYCMEHYPVSQAAIVVMPMTRGEVFSHESDRKALAIVPVNSSASESEEDEEEFA
jgi:hypothetical protein